MLDPTERRSEKLNVGETLARIVRLTNWCGACRPTERDEGRRIMKRTALIAICLGALGLIAGSVMAAGVLGSVLSRRRPSAVIRTSSSIRMPPTPGT